MPPGDKEHDPDCEFPQGFEATLVETTGELTIPFSDILELPGGDQVADDEHSWLPTHGEGTMNSAYYEDEQYALKDFYAGGADLSDETFLRRAREIDPARVRSAEQGGNIVIL